MKALLLPKTCYFCGIEAKKCTRHAKLIQMKALLLPKTCYFCGIRSPKLVRKTISLHSRSGAFGASAARSASSNKTASQSKEINQKSKDLVWIQEINLHSHESIRNQSKIKGLNLEWKESDHWLLLDCELGAWNPVFGNVDFWKMWILEKCEFWKNVNFGKKWILEKRES